MKILLLTVLMFISVYAFSQERITFDIEKLVKTKKQLLTESSDKVCENIILSYAGMTPVQMKAKRNSYNYNIVAKSQLPTNLVSFNCNPFFYGMYNAYAKRHTFVISPEMIWLLISQGFARHINANPEIRSRYFSNLPDKPSLTIQNLNNPINIDEIEKYIGKDLFNILSADFSMTNATEKVVIGTPIIENTRTYFAFKPITIVSGIPEMTIEGSAEDWQKILDKAQSLKKYELDWWISEIEPFLEEFVRASKGLINRSYWQNMFKLQTTKKQGTIVDGWIVKFFPYDKNGNRSNLKAINRNSSLPSEIVKIDVKLIEADTNNEIALELWSGFFGLEQDPENLSLRPCIGWFIRKAK